MLSKLKRNILSLTITLLIVFVIPILVLSLYALIDTIGDDQTGQYIKFTNIAFAFFAGISSLMFNWARSLDDSIYRAEIKIINHIAEYSILGGIGYILSSLLQYVETIDHTKGILSLLPSFYFSIVPIIVVIILSITAMISILIIAYIFWMYFAVRSVRATMDVK